MTKEKFFAELKNQILKKTGYEIIKINQFIDCCDNAIMTIEDENEKKSARILLLGAQLAIVSNRVLMNKLLECKTTEDILSFLYEFTDSDKYDNILRESITILKNIEK